MVAHSLMTSLKECFSRLRHFYPLTTHRVPKSKILFKKSISSQMTFFGFQKSSLHGFQKPCLHRFQNPSLLGFQHPSLDFKSLLCMDFKSFFAWILEHLILIQNIYPDLEHPILGWISACFRGFQKYSLHEFQKSSLLGFQSALS